jgi:hypothetical protein
VHLLYFIFLSYTFLNTGGVLDVDWSSIDKSQQKSSAAYPSVLTEGIKNVHLPVYLTKSYAYDKNMIVVSGANFYSISLELEGAYLLFEGDKTFQVSVSPSNPEFQKIVQNSLPVKYEESEGMMMAEFAKHAVNYAITIECEEPKKDKRCTQITLIESLYSELTMVGGRP